MINGIINVYKELGYTSFDVIAKLRGILRQKKIGHTGTLDPNACGVLPVCLGNATKLCDMLTDKDKVYETTMILGITTDTQDITGKVLEEKNVNLTEADVLEVIKSFVGTYEQLPPMYSALKVNGQKLCDLARQGIEVERKTRPVTVYDINIKDVDLPRITMEVACSKGTYIRTLCNDIGDKLGVGACVETLKRTKAGAFEISSSITLAKIEELVKEDDLDKHIISVSEMFEECGDIFVTPYADKLLSNGNKFVEANINTKTNGTDSERFKVHYSNGDFVGIYEYEEKTGQYKPVKMFL